MLWLTWALGPRAHALCFSLCPIRSDLLALGLLPEQVSGDKFPSGLGEAGPGFLHPDWTGRFPTWCESVFLSLGTSPPLSLYIALNCFTSFSHLVRGRGEGGSLENAGRAFPVGEDIV